MACNHYSACCNEKKKKHCFRDKFGITVATVPESNLFTSEAVVWNKVASLLVRCEISLLELFSRDKPSPASLPPPLDLKDLSSVVAASNRVVRTRWGRERSLPADTALCMLISRPSSPVRSDSCTTSTVRVRFRLVFMLGKN